MCANKGSSGGIESVRSFFRLRVMISLSYHVSRFHTFFCQPSRVHLFLSLSPRLFAAAFVFIKTKLIFIRIINSIFYFIYAFDRKNADTHDNCRLVCNAPRKRDPYVNENIYSVCHLRRVYCSAGRSLNSHKNEIYARRLSLLEDSFFFSISTGS